MLATEALKYQHRMEFVRGSFNAYQRAAKRGLLDSVCKHMGGSLRSADDMIYVWKAKGVKHNEDSIYKIGVTSERLGSLRIRQVANAHAFTPILLAMERTKGRASKLEKQLLEFGEDPFFDKTLDGFSEFRLLSELDLENILALITENIETSQPERSIKR